MKSFRSRQRALLVFAMILLAGAAWQVRTYFAIRQEWAETHVSSTAKSIRARPGFKASLLYSSDYKDGSWIAMTVDPEGRVIVSPEGGEPLLRLTLSRASVREITPIDQPVHGAMGLLYASNSLFLDCDGPAGWGIYRMIDNGGSYGSPQLLHRLEMASFQHGAHGLALGPDGKLYITCGDHTELPMDVSPTSPVRNAAEDQLLPREDDPGGLDVGGPPEGFVLRMDLDGRNCELFADGFRNIYQIAFNRDGELFGFDNDMEFDLGLPWYHPTRIEHIVSGGDYGFREGSGWLPEYDEDVVPAALNAGLGAPSGAAFPPATGTLPAAWRDACFMEDWTYGRLLAVHLTSAGGTYRADMETILQGTPLNLTSLAFSPDGALYFITGGSGIHSELYRLDWDGTESPATEVASTNASAARQLRHKLEAFQTQRVPNAVDFIWPSLGNVDRSIRFAARLALECQDLAAWQHRALADSNTMAGLTALLALARCGGRDTQPALLQALDKFPLDRLSPQDRLIKLRVLEISFVRQGFPEGDLAKRVMAELDSRYPSSSQDENYELCQLLLSLNAPGAVEKTLALMDQAPTQEEQIYYVMRLRTINKGWTLAQRRHYLGWFRKSHSSAHPPRLLQYFRDVGREYADGDRVDLYLDRFRREYVSTLTPDERGPLADLLPGRPRVPVFASSNRKFIKTWRMADLEPHLAKLKSRRLLQEGRIVFSQAQCLVCHHFGFTGGSFGPDLSAVGRRMAPRDILDSILNPSRVIAGQYQNTILTLTNGDVISGRVIGDYGGNLFLLTDTALTKTRIPKSEVETRRLSKISPMPEGLLDSFTEDQIWDLIALLKTGPHSIRIPPSQ